jgi:hypothetical protein
VIQAFNQVYSIESLLERHGYTKGRDRYVRPGGRSESVSVRDGRSVHWSSNDPLNDGKVKSGIGVHDAFDVFCYYEHGGDVRVAVKAAAEVLGLPLVHNVNVGKTPIYASAEASFVDSQGRSTGPGTTNHFTEPYQSFPVEVLPRPLADFASQGAKAIGCDPAYLALPLLAAMAAAVGNTRRIRLKDSWAEPAVLWTVVVAPSGTAKSPAFRLALRPLMRRQGEILAALNQAETEYRQERKDW